MASRFVFLLGYPRWNLHPRQNSFEAKINDKVFVCGLYFLRNRPDDKQPRVGRFRFSKQKCITNAI